MALITLDRTVLDVAWELDPPALRAIDAVHLASALALGDALGTFICYDPRLADAADAAHLPVLAPA
jgi:hypothetical protein